jgi:endonuclease-3 related protein
MRGYRATKMSATRALPQKVIVSAGHSGSARLPVIAEFAAYAPLTARTSGSQTHPPDPVPDSSLHPYFDSLFAAHGPQHWWPGRTRFEIIVGAILTQNTSWSNAERAIHNLRGARLLNPQGIRRVSSSRLGKLLRPSGYFRQKTKSLKAFVKFLFKTHAGSFSRLFATPTGVLREQLLAVRGIGPETADSILLYAGKHPVFVVDAYTRRILERHQFVRAKSTYEQIRKLFEATLPTDPQLFNEFHSLIVYTGKHFCHKSDPDCARCPLQTFLPTVAARSTQITSHESQATSHASAAGRWSLVAAS